MLAGLPARVQFTDMTDYYFGALPSDLDSLMPPPPGAPNTVIAFGAPEFDGFPDCLHVWQATTTWGATPTMTVTGPTDIATDPFNSDLCNFSRNCVPQLGTTTTVDAISDRMLWRLAYRNFGSHESLVVNHTVNVAAPLRTRGESGRNPVVRDPEPEHEPNHYPAGDLRAGHRLALDGLDRYG